MSLYSVNLARSCSWRYSLVVVPDLFAGERGWNDELEDEAAYACYAMEGDEGGRGGLMRLWCGVKLDMNVSVVAPVDVVKVTSSGFNCQSTLIAVVP